MPADAIAACPSCGGPAKVVGRSEQHGFLVHCCKCMTPMDGCECAVAPGTHSGGIVVSIESAPSARDRKWPIEARPVDDAGAERQAESTWALLVELAAWTIIEWLAQRADRE